MSNAVVDNPRVLYISYTGLLDPLGQSQVLQYALKLAGHCSFALLTFEKPENLANAEIVGETKDLCREAGIDWHYRPYSNRLGLLSKVYDIWTGGLAASRLARTMRSNIVHCRSYIAGAIGFLTKRRCGAAFLFDIRGFWPDERADAGIWDRRGPVYRLVKRLEKSLFVEADHVVSLTSAGAKEIKKFEYLQQRCPPVSVIPTCTNLNLFTLSKGAPPAESVEKTALQGPFTLGYVGSVGSWYLFQEVAKTVRLLFEIDENAQFRVINQGGHDYIKDELKNAGVDLSRVSIGGVPYSKVGNEIAKMDAGIFFIKPVWSKKASCPTRMGEFLACGKPCMANAGVGDVESDLRESGAGVCVTSFEESAIKQQLQELIALCRAPGTAERCHSFARKKFSLQSGVESYLEIYRSMLATKEAKDNAR